jgi:hypothetical protein
MRRPDVERGAIPEPRGGIVIVGDPFNFSARGGDALVAASASRCRCM